jgi:hypothetical protein
VPAIPAIIDPPPVCCCGKRGGGGGIGRWTGGVGLRELPPDLPELFCRGIVPSTPHTQPPARSQNPNQGLQNLLQQRDGANKSWAKNSLQELRPDDLTATELQVSSLWKVRSGKEFLDSAENFAANPKNVANKMVSDFDNFRATDYCAPQIAKNYCQLLERKLEGLKKEEFVMRYRGRDRQETLWREVLRESKVERVRSGPSEPVPTTSPMDGAPLGYLQPHYPKPKQVGLYQQRDGPGPQPAPGGEFCQGSGTQ